MLDNKKMINCLALCISERETQTKELYNHLRFVHFCIHVRELSRTMLSLEFMFRRRWQAPPPRMGFWSFRPSATESGRPHVVMCVSSWGYPWGVSQGGGVRLVGGSGPAQHCHIVTRDGGGRSAFTLTKRTCSEKELGFDPLSKSSRKSAQGSWRCFTG